jgi:hypothetical protein
MRSFFFNNPLEARIMSFLLTKTLVADAIDMVLPVIELCQQNGVFKRKDLHIVVSVPGIPPGSLSREEWMKKGILFEHSIGDSSMWEYPYDAIARSKCYLSWCHGMPTQILQTRAPWCLDEGDTIYYGSAVSDGLVVAVSGVQPYYDQMISEMVLSACRALCIDAYTALVADSSVQFVGKQ